MHPFEGPNRWIRIRSRRHTVPQDVEDELAFHIASRTEDLVRQGLDPEAAARQAAEEFGSMGRARQELVGMDRRSTRRRARLFWWSDLGRDVRFAVRGLARRPGLAAALLFTLTLGIGATTAIFTVVYAALLRPPPYHEPDRLVLLWETSRTGNGISEASWPDFLDLRDQGLLAGLEGWDPTNVTLLHGEQPRFLRGARVTAGFFSLLGVRPSVGRGFQPGEDDPGGSPVVMVSHDFWSRELGRAAPGARLMIDGRNHEIIGVLPPGFHFTPAGEVPIWLPIGQGAEVRQQRFNHWLNLVGRLPGDVPLEQATARLSAVMQRLASAWPESNSGRGILVQSLRDAIAGPVRPVLLVLLAAVGLLLLNACVNVASLLLARALSRSREIAVRMALGASRLRLTRQLVTESLVLSLLGGLAGLLFAHASVRLMVSRLPAGLLSRMAWIEDLRPQTEALLFVLALATVVGVVLGLAPARQTGQSLRAGLADGPSARGWWSGRDLLVMGQLAVTVVLLIGAGLAGRSLMRLLEEPAGFSTESILTARVPLSGTRYREGPVQQRFFESLLEELRRIPGVRAAGAVTQLPLNGGGTLTYWVEGLLEPPTSERWSVVQRGVAGEYFEVMGIPLVSGRFFTPADDSNSTPAIIISQSLAQRHFRGTAAIGRRFRFYALQGQPWQIIGVVGDVKTGPLDQPPPPTIYYSHLQAPENRMTLVMAIQDENRVIPALRASVRAVDPGLPVHDVRTMEEVVTASPSVVARRYPLAVIGCFAGAALILALVGVYGVVSFSVERRARELAVRSALGADRLQLVAPVLRHACAMTVLGIGVGLVLALVAGRFLKSVLYGVPPNDLLTYAGIAVLLFAVTMAATLVPAGRAAAANPVDALRAE